MGMAALVAPENRWPTMATTAGLEAKRWATAAPTSGEAWSSSAICSNLWPLNSPASVRAMAMPCEASMPNAETSPVIGPAKPILMASPASKTAQPPASVPQTAGAPPAGALVAGTEVGSPGAAVGAGVAGAQAASTKLNTKIADRIRRAFIGVPPPQVPCESTVCSLELNDAILTALHSSRPRGLAAIHIF
jgi:hypothetical protein